MKTLFESESNLQIHEERIKVCLNSGIKTFTITENEENRVDQFQTMKHGVDILVATPDRLTEYSENKKNFIRYDKSHNN